MFNIIYRSISIKLSNVLKLFLIFLLCFNLSIDTEAATIKYQYSKKLTTGQSTNTSWNKLYISGNLVTVSSASSSDTLDIMDENGNLKYRATLKDLTGIASPYVADCSLSDLRDGTFIFTCEDRIIRMNTNGQILFSTVFPYSALPYYEVTFEDALNDRNGGIILVGEIMVGRSKAPIFVTTRYDMSGNRVWYTERSASDYDSMFGVTLNANNTQVNVFYESNGDDSKDSVCAYNVTISSGSATYAQGVGVSDYSLGVYKLDDYNILFTTGDSGSGSNTRRQGSIHGFLNGSKSKTKELLLSGTSSVYGYPRAYYLAGVVKLPNGNILAAASIWDTNYQYQFVMHEMDSNMNLLDNWSAGASWYESVGYTFIDSNNNLKMYNQRTSPNATILVFSPPPPTLSISGTQSNNTTLGVNYSVVDNGNYIQTYQIFNPDNNVNYYSGAWTSWTKYFNPGTYRFAARILAKDGSVLATSNTVSMTVASPTISISTSNTYIGDNTPHKLNISYNTNGVSIGSLRVINSSTGAIYYNSSPTTSFSQLLPVGTMNLKVTLNDTNGTVFATSGSVTIDKREVLSNALAALKSGTIPTKILILGDRDRYYEVNSANQQLVSQIKSSASGVYLIQNNTSALFDSLLE